MALKENGWYAIHTDELKIVERVKRRLYDADGKRLNADDTRDLAHALAFVLDHLLEIDDDTYQIKE